MAAHAATGRGRGGHTLVPFLCECADPGCSELQYLTLGEFGAIRRSGRALTASGHSAPGELVRLP
jgi:hypothetical protein